MNSNFDLNIDNYKLRELEEIFDLPPNYDLLIIDIKEETLKQNIMSDNAVKPDIKQQTMQFISQAKDAILKKMKKIEHVVGDAYNANFNLQQVAIVNNEGSNFVQERDSKPYVSSYPGEFFPGIINPIKKRTTRQTLNIDTRFRENYYSSQSSNFHVDLPLKLSSILTMQLTAIELPTSFYVISKQLNNYFFQISANDESAIITIPNGTYNTSDLIVYLNSELALLTSTTYLKNLCFVVNLTNSASGSGQILVGVQSSYTGTLFDFTLNFQADDKGNPDYSTPLPLKFGWLLGFRNGIYENNSSYLTEGVVDLSGPRYVYLSVDDYNNNVNNGFYSAFNSSLLNKNILARISLGASNSFSVMSENNLSLITYPRQYFGPVDIQKMNIQLLDEYGRVLDLNNMDFSFCLTFETVYDI